MTITASDIKLLASERMTDATDGGGRMTSNEIVSGELSNIFPKVSRTDAVYGRVNLRKVYAAVKSATLDMYGGAHAIVADAADDLKIGTLLFSTNSSFDTRTTARDKIESYVVSGPLSRLKLYGNQIVGAKAIACYQRPEEALPDIGDVLLLSVESGVDSGKYQYVRITEYTNEVRTFTDDKGDFQKRMFVMKISSPLTLTFVGAEVTRVSADPAPTKVRITVVADATKYYGIQPVSEAVPLGALEIGLDSVYGQLVPSTTRETPVSGAGVAAVNGFIAASDYAFSPPVFTIVWPAPYSFTFIKPIKPGSLSGAWSSNNFGVASGAAHDDGKGALVFTVGAGFWSGGGSVNYEEGSVVLNSSGVNNLTNMAWSFIPAAEANQPAHTRSTTITLATRGTVYVETLNPLPAKSSVTVEYRAMGRWYKLTDDGAGALVADSAAIGAGSINYTTGSAIVTLGALPDMDSAVIFSWGSPVHTVIRTTDAGATVKQRFTLGSLPISSSGFSFIYRVGGADRTVTADASGVLSGPGITAGTVDFNTGVVAYEYNDKLPDVGSLISVAYNQIVPQTPGQEITYYSSSFDCGAVAGFTDIAPGTLRGTVRLASLVSFSVGVVDDGLGNIKTVSGLSSPNIQIAAGQVVGVVNYATGLITPVSAIGVRHYIWTNTGPGQFIWRDDEITVTVTGPVSFTWKNTTTGTTTAAVAVDIAIDGSVGSSPPFIDLTRTTSQVIVPESVIFTLAGETYWDRAGTLYTLSGADWLPSGTIDYDGGTCPLTFWANNTALAFSVQACLTSYGEFWTDALDFRTAGSPIRPGSFYIQATSTDGVLLSATSDSNGVISGTNVSGHITQSMGSVHVDFAVPIFPSTVSYNSVVLSNLPLDQALLGLDPVRLPSDGRVPIYRPGDIVVLHHSQTTTLPNPVTNGNSYSLGRDTLATATVVDSLGAAVAGDKWSANLVNGTVTIAADANLAAYTQPLKVVHRIEQMNLATDVQINGDVAFAAPTARAFPSGSLLSSCLPFGDMFARVSNVFDLATFSVWSDTAGAGATAQYNDISYPIEVLNNGCVTERWRISFTSTTAFAIIGENLGQIATGTTAADVQVVNLLTGLPYFTLRAAGWGSGWATGNQLRFNTYGANAPIWIARTILGGATLNGDAMTVEVRGDTD